MAAFTKASIETDPAVREEREHSASRPTSNSAIAKRASAVRNQRNSKRPIGRNRRLDGPTSGAAAQSAAGQSAPPGQPAAPVSASLENRGAQLAAAPAAIRFHSTDAGNEVRREVVVTNDGSNAVLLEDGHVVDDTPFHDFQLLVPNERLEPGASASVTAVFAPSRVGAFRSTASVLTDRGVGATVDLEGRAVQTRVSNEQRQKVQEAERARRKTQLDDPLFIEKNALDDQVDDWVQSLTEVAEDVSTWSSVNWTTFISRTAGDIHVAFTEGQFRSALGSVASGVAGLLAPGGPVGAL